MKYLISLIATVVIFVAIVGAYFYPKSPLPVGTITTSPTTVFNSAKVAATGLNPTTASATSSAVLLNTDSNDRVITDAFAQCSGTGTSLTYLTGTGLASLTFNMSTSSVTTNSNSSAVNIFSLTIATSTPDAYTASSTNPFPNPVTRIWPSGTYLIITANATNTAACVTGVHYLAS